LRLILPDTVSSLAFAPAFLDIVLHLRTLDGWLTRILRPKLEHLDVRRLLIGRSLAG
jgi:hypothetical protein